MINVADGQIASAPPWPVEGAEGSRFDWDRRIHASGGTDLLLRDRATGRETVIASDIVPSSFEVYLPPLWSMSGRFLSYVDMGELRSDPRPYRWASFVYDTATGRTTRLGTGNAARGVGHGVAWSPEADHLVYIDGANVAVYDPISGTRRTIFSGGGCLPYFPQFTSATLVTIRIDPRDDRIESLTALLSIDTGVEIGRWAARGIVATIAADRLFVAIDHPAGALQCDGVLVGALDSTATMRCLGDGRLIGGQFAAWAPQGTMVAVTRALRVGGDIRSLRDSTSTDAIVLYDPVAETERELLARVDLGSCDIYAIAWTSGGAQLLARRASTCP